MGIYAINHVQFGFPAGQQSLVRHFYGQLLGLQEFRALGGETLRFFAGPQRVDLVPVPDWRAPLFPSLVAFEVQNLPGLRAKLIDAGFDIDEARPLGGHLRFYVKDPAGNTLEFLEPNLSQESTA